MSSPVAGARPVDRRRQRSTRLVVASLLIAVAAVSTLAALLSGSVVLLSLAAVGAAVLGAAAARITHSELMQARRDAARDAAERARDYARLDSIRVSENRAFADSVTHRIEALQAERAQLRLAFDTSEANVAALRLKLGAEARRAEAAEQQLAQSEERAAEAIVRMMELEHELDVLQSQYDAAQVELHAWQPRVRHA